MTFSPTSLKCPHRMKTARKKMRKTCRGGRPTSPAAAAAAAAEERAADIKESELAIESWSKRANGWAKRRRLRGVRRRRQRRLQPGKHPLLLLPECHLLLPLLEALPQEHRLVLPVGWTCWLRHGPALWPSGKLLLRKILMHSHAVSFVTVQLEEMFHVLFLFIYLFFFWSV